MVKILSLTAKNITYLLVVLGALTTTYLVFDYHQNLSFGDYKTNIISTESSEGLLLNRGQGIPIRDSESLVKYLGIHSWTHRKCSFRSRSEKQSPRRSEIYSQCSSINIRDALHSESLRPPHWIEEEKFTVLINTWHRNECLISSVRHYLQCHDVAQIRVIWSDPQNAIPAELHSLRQTEPRLVFDEYANNKLTDRFKFNALWITEGIFNIDDDLKLSCNILSATFRLWRVAPRYLIGFHPRQPIEDLLRHRDRKVHRDRLRSRSFYEWRTAFKECRYSMLWGTLGGFMHREYYELYSADTVEGSEHGIPWNSSWKAIRDQVDEYVTAEDISMSLLYSFHSGLPPIAVLLPESELMVHDFLKCSKLNKSKVMHSESGPKRTAIFLNALEALGFYRNGSAMDLVPSSLFVDVVAHDNGGSDFLIG